MLTAVLNHRRERDPHPEWGKLLAAAIAASTSAGAALLPVGGGTHTVLRKSSPTNFATEWASLAPVAWSGAYNDLLGIPSTFAPAAHTQDWSTITGTPTTLAGYGITDGAGGNMARQ